MILKNCNSAEFIKQLNGKKVICFGAGTTLIEADFEVLTIPELENHIAFFVDNDKNKHVIKYQYRNYTYDIVSPDILETINSSEYVILITCAFYVEIYEQIKNIKNLKDIECYMYNCICSYPELDLQDFFEIQIKKEPYANYRERLSALKLKNKHQGQRCFIIGNGPSLKAEDLEKLKGEYTFAANRIFKIMKYTSWTPTYYLCTDYLMYGLDHKEINKIDAVLRFVPIERALAAGEIYNETTYYNRVVNCTQIIDGKITINKNFMFSDDIVDKVYGGQTVLYDAIQLAVYMGFKDIYLLGVDNNYKNELKEDGSIVHTGAEADHFCDEYDEGLEEKIAVVARLYLSEIIFETANIECQKRGVNIKNATRGGKLEVFERISLEELGL